MFKKLSLIFSFVFLVISVSSQVSVSWEITHGDSDEEEARSIINAKDGGYYVVGYTESYGNGKKDAWLLKLDKNAEIEWDLTFGGPDDDEFYDIIETHKGNLAIVGYTESQGNGKADFWFMLTDNEGDALYTKTFGGDKDDFATRVTQALDSNFLISGRTESFGSGKSNQYIVKVEPKLDQKQEQGRSRFRDRPVWYRYNGGRGYEDAGSIVHFKGDSLIYVLGNTTAYSNGAMDAYVITIDDNYGRVKDRANYGGRQYERAHDFIMNDDGSFMIFGLSRTETAGLEDGWITFIFKDEFYQEWEKKYGGEHEDIFISAVKNEKNYLIAGHTRSKGQGNYDAWLFISDFKGEKIWEDTYGDVEDEKVHKLIKSNDGGYIMVGSTNSTGMGKKDVWIVKLD